MKLFGGFHGNRTRSGKKPVPTETEEKTPFIVEKAVPREEKRPEAKAEEPPKPSEPPKRPETPAEAEPAKPAASPAEEPTRVIEPVAAPVPEPAQEPEPAAQPPEEAKPTEAKAEQPVSEEPTIAWTPEKADKEPVAEGTKEIRFRTPEEEAEIEEIIAAYQKKKRRRRIIIAAVLVALIAGGFILWKSLVKPPEIIQPTARPTAEPTVQPTVTPKPADPVEATPTEAPPEETPVPQRMRRENVYTIMLVGRDQGFGNTDAIMVGVFDTEAGTVNVVSIPRDTCANVESDPMKSELKKISGVYSRTDFDGLRDAVSDMVGFPIDCYVSVGVNGFIQLVQTIGGVTFYVPHNMNYDDPTQNLHIHFSAGEQFIDGYDAIKIVRWRQNNDGTNYGDIDRINTQQEFLKTVFKKCLSMDSLVNNLDEYIKIFQEYVKTDLSTGNMTWFAKEALKLKMEDIHFYTMPTNPSDMIYGFSYGTVLVDEWLEMLNENLNPYDQPIELEDVDLIYRDENGDLCATSGEVKGGMESFLHMEDYIRRLNAWQASQKKDEESSGSGDDTNGGE